jgi:hypothetical protein
MPNDAQPHPRSRQRRNWAIVVSVLLIVSLMLPWMDAVGGGLGKRLNEPERTILSGSPGLLGVLLNPLGYVAFGGVRALLLNRREQVVGFALTALLLTGAVLGAGFLFWASTTFLFFMYLGISEPVFGIGLWIWCGTLLVLLASSRLCGHPDEWTDEHPLGDFLRRHLKPPA